MDDVVKVEQAPAPARDFGDVLLAILKDPAIPADKLEIVLAAQAANVERQAREAFNAAFSIMQAEIPQVTKEGIVHLSNDRTGKSYKFARWEDMDKVIRPILSKHGFALAFRTQIVDGHWQLVGELARGVYSRQSTYPLTPDSGPGRNAAQAWGSGMSYAKRYTAEALLNIVRSGDNDANDAGADEVLTAAQLQTLKDELEATNSDLARFLRVMVTGVERLEDIKQRDYQRLYTALGERRKRKPEATK